jgi:hypothetical protein
LFLAPAPSPELVVDVQHVKRRSLAKPVHFRLSPTRPPRDPAHSTRYAQRMRRGTKWPAHILTSWHKMASACA